MNVFTLNVLNLLIDFLRNLCKKGLPEGNVFEYAALEMLKYERILKRKDLKAKTKVTISKFLGSSFNTKLFIVIKER